MEIRHQAVKEFALWIASNPLPGRHRRGSENTLKGYIGDLGLFANWFKQSTSLDLGAETLTPDDIQDYISHAQTVEKKDRNDLALLCGETRLRFISSAN